MTFRTRLLHEQVMKADKQKKGLVFDIKQFAIHDGKGIRSTVFLKGCPLECKWCQNPEGIHLSRRLWYFSQKCMQCKICLQVCQENALEKQWKKHTRFSVAVDHSKCTGCGACTAACPTNALSFDSSWMSPEEVVNVLAKDEMFYEDSGGGVSLSGGDPVIQHEFSAELLRACKERGYHTAVETSLYAPETVIDTFIKLSNVIIADVKLIFEEEHRQHTGKGNSLILRNLEKVAASSAVDLKIRIPVIPGFTAKYENLTAIGNYLRVLDENLDIELINFNNLAKNKYQTMGLPYPFSDNEKPYSDLQMYEFYQMIRRQDK